MYMLIGALLFAVVTGIYYFVYANNFSIYDIELEHLILYNRNKPFVKWVAISGYYLFFALFVALITNPKLTIKSFYITQSLFIAFCIAAYFLWMYYNDIVSTNVTSTSPDSVPGTFGQLPKILQQITNGIFNFPFLLLLGSLVITTNTLSSN